MNVNEFMFTLNDELIENSFIGVEIYKEYIKHENNSNKVIDMTKYEDMSDLLLISDCLITDYSSCAGDFILRKKMILLYQPDYDEYVHNEREGYFDIEDSPYLVGKNTEEICEIVRYLDDDKARRNALAIMDFYKTVETGFSTKKVVEYINRLSFDDTDMDLLLEQESL